MAASPSSEALPYQGTLALACDLTGFSKMSDHERLEARRLVFGAMDEKVAPYTPFGMIERGGSRIALLPDTVAPFQIVDEVVPQLMHAASLRSNGPRFGLRMAIARGRTVKDPWGWIGTGVVNATTMLRARTYREFYRSGVHAGTLATTSTILRGFRENQVPRCIDMDKFQKIEVESTASRSTMWVGPVSI